MFCPNCGNKLEKGQSFCAVCGNVIDFADDVTIGAFENSTPVAPQPEYVEPVVPVAPQPEYVEPVADEATIGVYESFTPVAPQAEYEAPVIEEAVAVPTEPQYDFGAPVVPQDNFVTPVAPVAPATDVPPAATVDAAETKKEKKRNAFLIGFFSAVALGLIAGIIALVVFLTRPDVSIVRAAKKTILDSKSFSFELYWDGEGKVAEGKVAFGENHKDSGFYVTSGEEYEEIGYYNNTIYTSDGSVDLEENLEYINETLGEMGFDITVEEALDMLIDEEIKEKAIFDIYESQYDNLVEILDERDIDIELPDPKEVKSSALDVFKGIPEDAFDFEQDLGFGKKTIKYEVDLEKLLVGIIENLSEDEEYQEFFEDFEDETGNDVDDIIDELEDSEYPDVEGKAVIEWGRLVEFSLKIDGEGFKIKFKDINKTEVNQKTMDAIEVRETDDEYYDDGYVEGDGYYDDYYDGYVNPGEDVYVDVGGGVVVDDDYYYEDYYDDYYDDSYYDDYYDDSYYDDYYDDDYYGDDYYYGEEYYEYY